MAARPWSAFKGDNMNIRSDLDDGGPEDPASWEQEIDQVIPTSRTTKHGTCVLIGWLGAAERHLFKYSTEWSDLGWDAVMLRAPFKDTVHRSAMEAMRDRWVDEIEEMQASNDSDWRLVFHVFSNTGWLCYGGMLETFEQRNSKVLHHICGVVSDSCPEPKPSAQLFASGFYCAMWPHRKFNANDMRMQMLKAFMKVRLQGGPAAALKTVAECVSRMQDFPQLYIYSTDDVVIPYMSVEKVMRDQLRLGRRVHSLKLDGSPHVQHMRFDKAVYIHAISQWVQLEVIGKGKSLARSRSMSSVGSPREVPLGRKSSLPSFQLYGLPMDAERPPTKKELRKQQRKEQRRRAKKAKRGSVGQNEELDEGLHRASVATSMATSNSYSDESQDEGGEEAIDGGWGQEQDAALLLCLEQLRVSSNTYGRSN